MLFERQGIPAVLKFWSSMIRFIIPLTGLVGVALASINLFLGLAFMYGVAIYLSIRYSQPLSTPFKVRDRFSKSNRYPATKRGGVRG